jgi:hypothetical protein
MGRRLRELLRRNGGTVLPRPVFNPEEGKTPVGGSMTRRWGLLAAAALAATATGAVEPGLQIRRVGADLAGAVRAVQAADIDGDGAKDLVVIHRDKGRRLLSVLWGDGKGGLVRSEPLEVPQEAALCDVGDLTDERGAEIAFLTPRGVYTLPKTGRSFGPPRLLVEVPSLALMPDSEDLVFGRFVVDADGDGRDDLLVQDFRVVRLLKRGAGGAWAVASELPMPVETVVRGQLWDAERLSPAVARFTYSGRLLELRDFDGDGRQDLGFRWRDRLAVFFQSEAGFRPEDRVERDFGVFEPEEPSSQRSWVGRVADLDGDGLADVLLGYDLWGGTSKKASRLWLFRGERPAGARLGWPQQPTQVLDVGDSMVQSLRLNDLSGDGRPDLVMVSFRLGLMGIVKMLLTKSMTVQAEIYDQGPDGKFSAEARDGVKMGLKLRFAGGSGTPLVEYADFDGDGRQDLVYGTDKEELSYFLGRPGGVADQAAAKVGVSPYGRALDVPFAGGPGTDLVVVYPDVKELAGRVEVLFDAGIGSGTAAADP